MPASTVRCYVLGGDVTVVADMNGIVTNVVCPEFDRLTHGCLKKGRESSFLGLLIAKVADKASGVTRGGHCEFGDPLQNPMSRALRGDL